MSDIVLPQAEPPQIRGESCKPEVRNRLKSRVNEIYVL
jgi:hypothetical protein